MFGCLRWIEIFHWSALVLPKTNKTSTRSLFLEWQHVYLLSLNQNCQAVLDKNDILTLIKQTSMKNKHKNDDTDLGLVHCEDAALFAASRGDWKRLLMTADKLINNRDLSDFFHAQFFHHLCEKCSGDAPWIVQMPCPCQRYHCSGPISIVGFLSTAWETMAARMAQSLTVLQQYLSVTCVFASNSNDMRLKWKSVGEERHPPERELDKGT